jgi:hypothetical protein
MRISMIPSFLYNKYQLTTNRIIMKTLETLNNVERAKLLFELFPDAIPAFLDCAKVIASRILKDPDSLKEQWNGVLITAGFWIELAKDTSQRIDKYHARLQTSSRLFSEQLFDGYNALFSSHCLQQYAANETCTNKRFAQLVAVLF